MADSKVLTQQMFQLSSIFWHHGAPGRESAHVRHAGDDEGGTGEPEQGIGGESPGKDQVNQAWTTNYINRPIIFEMGRENGTTAG